MASKVRWHSFLVDIRNGSTFLSFEFGPLKVYAGDPPS